MTIPNVKVREDATPVDESTAVTPVSKPISKADRHEELRKRGEQKRQLLAALNPKPLRAVIRQDITPVQAETPSKPAKKPRKVMTLADFKLRKGKNGNTSLFEESDGIKTSLDPRKPQLDSRHSDKTRQKMRERERAKREKLRVKKEAKIEKKRPAAKPATTPWERPTETIRELGMKLAQKLAKDTSGLHSAYESIKKREDIV